MPAQRETVCAAARKAAGAVNYVGAGTIEFVSDGKDVFFIEMNTRLQVEHPVTELITGIDLVEWQLRVAFGEKLPLTQDQITLNGHAIEARVYAENPHKNFMPSVGRIRTWHTPAEENGLRIDAGYRAGDAVSPHYDAMLAKVIAWAPTRDLAIERLNRGLEETDVRGIVSNIPFLSALVTHPQVRANTIDTGFIERELKNLTPEAPAPHDLELCAAVVAILGEEATARRSGGAFAVANRGLDAGRPAAAAIHVPARAGRRTQGEPGLRQRSGDAVDRRPRTGLRILARHGRRLRSQAARHQIPCRRRDRRP